MDFPNLTGTWALDLETKDPALNQGRGPGWCFPEGHIIGVAVAWDEGRQSAYYPVRHEMWGGNLSPPQVFLWLEDQLRKPDAEVVFHNGLYDRGWLRAEGVPFIGRAHDTQTAGGLLDEYRDSYGLDALAKDYIGERKDTRLIEAYAASKRWHPKKDLWRMPADIVAPYAKQDAGATLRLWQVLWAKLREDDLLQVYDLEMRLQPVLLEMRQRGVRVDEEKAHEVKKRLRQREDEINRKLTQMTGIKFKGLWAAEPIAQAARKLDIPFGRTTADAPSFTKEYLRGHVHPFMRLVGEWREVNKMRTTFIEGHVLGHAHNGRIHCEFHPLRKGDKNDDLGGTVTGRMSSSNPNLQQLVNPKRHPERYEEAKLLRQLFLPELGEQWGAADYSQQEPRLVVHYAELCHFAGVGKVVDQYHADPKTDFHKLLATMTLDLAQTLFKGGISFDNWRAITKNTGLGIIYGMGEPKLCRTFGMPTKFITKRRRDGTEYQKEVAGDEGRAILDTFFGNAPYIRELNDLCIRRARQRGWIRTYWGRLCRFDRDKGWTDAHLGGASTHKALNRLIQGSAADQTKLAMVQGYEDHGIVPLVAVHDEEGVSGDEDKFRILKHVMETCAPLKIPSLVEVRAAQSWGDTL